MEKKCYVVVTEYARSSKDNGITLSNVYANKEEVLSYFNEMVDFHKTTMENNIHDMFTLDAENNSAYFYEDGNSDENHIFMYIEERYLYL